MKQKMKQKIQILSAIFLSIGTILTAYSMSYQAFLLTIMIVIHTYIVAYTAAKHVNDKNE